MDKLETYNLLQDIHKHIFEQLKYAELKNGILLTLLIGVLYFISTNLVINAKVYIVCLLLLNIGITLFSFFPYLSSFTLWNDKNNDQAKNLYFFESIKNYTDEGYLKMLLEANNDLINKNNQLFLNLSNQIIVLSKITSKKHLLYKTSFIYFCTLSFITISIYFLGIK